MMGQDTIRQRHHKTRRRSLVGVPLLTAAAMWHAPHAAAAIPLRGPDFNNDGYADAAISAPFEDNPTPTSNAGAVFFLWGSSSGLDTDPGLTGLLAQHVANVEGTGHESDHFGYSLAWGNFDGDCYDDLLVGVPFEQVGAGPTDGGAVQVFYGASTGLSVSDDEIISRESANMNDSAGANDRFGFAVAAGDFNGDGYDDAAAGSWDDDVGAVSNAGSVHIVYGSASGLSPTAGPGDAVLTQDSTSFDDSAEADDHFGNKLAAGDFNCDSYTDLAIGVWGEDSGAGAVHVVYGSSGGLSPTSVEADQVWTQDTTGVLDSSEATDGMAFSLVAGNFDGDTSSGIECEDLAIGVEGETLNGISNAGAVAVLYGSSADGLVSTDNDLWDQDDTNVDNLCEANDGFGSSLAVGYFNDDDYPDLAVGIAGEDSDGGAIHLTLGSSSGLTVTSPLDDRFWHQNTFGILDSIEAGDEFGHCISTGDFDADGYSDIGACVPGEETGATTDIGMLAVIYVTDNLSGPTISSQENWDQDALGYGSETDDEWGWAATGERHKDANCP